LSDGSFGGASITDAKVIGYADLNGDAILDAVLGITCFGSPIDMCCAGRASILTYALPVTPSPTGSVEVLGSPIEGGPERKISTIRMSGRRVVTHECVIYPETLTKAELGYPPDAEVVSTYTWHEAQWSRSDEVRAPEGCS
jgi:hypothetical protein